MNRPAEHSLVAAWVQSGNHRVRCSCDEVFIASTRAIAQAQFDAHREPESEAA